MKKNKITSDDLAYILGIASVIIVIFSIHMYPVLIGR